VSIVGNVVTICLVCSNEVFIEHLFMPGSVLDWGLTEEKVSFLHFKFIIILGIAL
jgi:hypothetical protein